LEALVCPRPARIMGWALVEAARRGYCENCWSTRGPFHVHHIKSRGAGGGDEPENLISLCWECHRKVHDGQLVLGPRKPEPPSLDLLVQAFSSGESDAQDLRWGQAAVAAVMVEWMGMTPRQASSELGCSPAQVRELHRVFCAFPEPSSRAQDLSFRHHEIAARTADPQGWLDQALKNGWSTRRFQEAVRAVEDPVESDERARQKAERLLRAVREVLEAGGEAGNWLRAELGRVVLAGTRVPGGVV